jgi:hypothetical protein
LLRFKEKGGKEKELPVHHKLEEILDQYLKATGLEKEPGSPFVALYLNRRLWPFTALNSWTGKPIRSLQFVDGIVLKSWIAARSVSTI